MEVYLPGPGEQIHELNPTQFPPVGLFWTVPIPSSGVEVDLSNGIASMHALRIPIFDYQTRNNSFFGGGPDPVSGEMSFEVVWSGGSTSVPISNPTEGFAGNFIVTTAQIRWTASVGDYVFSSADPETSTSSVAVIGQETNGSFLQG
jgi:hypothetical protein